LDLVRRKIPQFCGVFLCRKAATKKEGEAVRKLFFNADLFVYLYENKFKYSILEDEQQGFRTGWGNVLP
jgi:hypothetical protein